ncbi:MAG: hypothetical protein ACW98F_11445, partial [Candidatus Hodarchaeales archaeon]
MQEKINFARIYYQSWADQDKRKALECLSKDNFSFKSPQGNFSDADKFMNACWVYSQGLTKVEFL